MKIELATYFGDCGYIVGLSPFRWHLRLRRQPYSDFTFWFGPLYADIMACWIGKGWTPPQYFTKDIRGYRFGLSLDCIGPHECPYLKRLILWLGPLGNIRLHKFYRSDEERALHDHPWPFVTFPLSTYKEWIPYTQPGDGTNGRVLNTVKRFRFHYRPAEYQHAVVVDKPGFTLVWAAHKGRSWGFWKNGIFTPWKKWLDQNPPACADKDEVEQMDPFEGNSDPAMRQSWHPEWQREGPPDCTTKPEMDK